MLRGSSMIKIYVCPSLCPKSSSRTGSPKCFEIWYFVAIINVRKMSILAWPNTKGAIHKQRQPIFLNLWHPSFPLLAYVVYRLWRGTPSLPLWGDVVYGWPLISIHSGCLDPKKILSTIDPPPGVPGVSKNHIFFFSNESVFLLR